MSSRATEKPPVLKKRIAFFSKPMSDIFSGSLISSAICWREERIGFSFRRKSGNAG
jgi:hypothetical protein